MLHSTAQRPRNDKNRVCSDKRRSPGEVERARHLAKLQHADRAAHMQETTKHPTTAPEETDGLAAAALQAEAWAGEPFLRADEDPAAAIVLPDAVG